MGDLKQGRVAPSSNSISSNLESLQVSFLAEVIDKEELFKPYKELKLTATCEFGGNITLRKIANCRLNVTFDFHSVASSLELQIKADAEILGFVSSSNQLELPLTKDRSTSNKAVRQIIVDGNGEILEEVDLVPQKALEEGTSNSDANLEQLAEDTTQSDQDTLNFDSQSEVEQQASTDDDLEIAGESIQGNEIAGEAIEGSSLSGDDVENKFAANKNKSNLGRYLAMLDKVLFDKGKSREDFSIDYHDEAQVQALLTELTYNAEDD